MARPTRTGDPADPLRRLDPADALATDGAPSTSASAPLTSAALARRRLGRVDALLSVYRREADRLGAALALAHADAPGGAGADGRAPPRRGGGGGGGGGGGAASGGRIARAPRRRARAWRCVHEPRAPYA